MRDRCAADMAVWFWLFGFGCSSASSSFMLGGDAAVRRRHGVAPSISLYLLNIYRCAACVTKTHALRHQNQRSWGFNFTKTHADRHQNPRSLTKLHQNPRRHRAQTSPKPTHFVTKTNAGLLKLSDRGFHRIFRIRLGAGVRAGVSALGYRQNIALWMRSFLPVASW